MSGIHEQLSEQFRRWELRGRGWQVFDEPVHPEPPFVPFHGHFLPDVPLMDDGRRSTFLSSFVQKLGRKLNHQSQPVEPETEREEEPEPQLLVRNDLIELQTSLPADLDIGKEAFEQFIHNLALCREPVAFELLGTAKHVNVQFVAGQNDALHVRRQLQAYFPEAVFQSNECILEQAWDSCEGDEMLAVEFGLAREFMFQLGSGKLDPFIGMVGALAELQPSDLGLFQVIFQPAQEPWIENIMRSVTHKDGKPFFVNQPELTSAAEKKITRPLYAAVVRIAAKGKTFERALQIACGLASSLRVFAQPQGNELIPLKNDDYPFHDHIEDVLRRQSRRSGMLLNSDELIGFVHLPSSAVRTPALERDTGKTKAAPAIVRNAAGLLLGDNVYVGESIPVRLTTEQRVRHCHIIGVSGTGKSTLLFNLIRQDIENGEGVAVLDPHGDLVDKILGIIPPNRISDVVLVDPSDEQYSVGFNILSAHSDLEKNLLASDLIAVFERLSTSWGDQMNSVLQNAILAFLESDRHGTIADLRRFLIEPSFRNEFLKSVRDSEVIYYWQKSFPHLSGNKSIGSILTRLDTFLAKKPIRHMVSQSENRLDFAQIMDSGKIFLAKLPEGLLGKENSYLLGTLMVSKFQQMAMSRQAQQIAARRDFWIYIDEFANFITPSMAEILSGARKYRIGLTLAHHELHQLQRNPEVASAVMSHPFTRVVFRVGDDDAKRLAEGFSHFEAKDLRNLDIGQAIARVERSDFDFNLTVPRPDEPDNDSAATRRQEVITCSRNKYGTARADVDAMLAKSRAVPPTNELPAVFPSAKQTTSTPQPEPIRTVEVPPLSPPVVMQQPAEPPQLSEVPNVPETTPESVLQKTTELKDLGRGLALHKSIQERLQTEARKLGFLAEVEKQLTKGSNKAADLVLRQGELAIAVEIALSTSINHEFENVKKCFDAGLPRVAVIATNQERLDSIATAVRAGLGSETAAKVSYHTPDGFIVELQKMVAEMPKNPAPQETPGVRKSHGRTVRRHLPSISPEEQKEKDAVLNKMLGEVMRTQK